MDKLSFIALWDVYRGLLTPTQQEITDLYFNLDLTLSEIAEQKGITRQGVSECLKTCKKQLEEYEEKLHFAHKLKDISLEISSVMTDACIWAQNFKNSHPEFAAETDKLLQIINSNHTGEIASPLNGAETR